MANSGFSNIDFGFRFGTQDQINRTSIENGTFYIDTENGNFYVDINSRRIPLNDILFGYTENEIRSIPIPDNKVYFSKDTYNILFFDNNELSWRKVGGEYANYARSDQNGNVIDTTYETKSNVASATSGLQDQIDALDQKVDSINRFNVEFYDSVENLPEIGTKFVIYFVPSTSDNGDESDATDNVCVEFIWIETGENEGYYEQIGLATVDLGNYYTKEDSDDKFETKLDASSKESTLSDNISSVAGDLSSYKTTVSNTYETKSHASSTYETSSHASSTYETKTDASSKESSLSDSIGAVASDLSDYKTEVANTYMTKESAAQDTGSVSAALELYKTDVANTYETKSHASSTYETSSHASSTYETKTDASSTYATKTGLSDSVAAINTSLSDYAKKSQSIASISLSGTVLTVTTVSGSSSTIDITDAIESAVNSAVKSAAGITEETINGVKYDVMDYGEE